MELQVHKNRKLNKHIEVVQPKKEEKQIEVVSQHYYSRS